MNQPTILETIALIMAADKKPIHFERLPLEEKGIDLVNKAINRNGN